jgi:hypothetical protein
MFTKRLYRIALSAVITGTLSVWLACAGTGSRQSGWTPAPQIVKASRQMITEEGRNGKIEVAFPRIDNVPDYINDTIQGLVQSEIRDFRRQAHDNEQARRQTEADSLMPRRDTSTAAAAHDLSRYRLFMDYEEGEIDSHYVSLIFMVDAYVGGAHGNKKLHPFNFDLKSYEAVSFSDLVGDDPAFLQHVSDYCQRELRRQIRERDSVYVIDEKWLQEGAGPSENNYRNFTFERDTVTVYFEHYQVAPYSFGMFEVAVPRRH